MALRYGFTSALLFTAFTVAAAQQPQPGMPTPGTPTAPQGSSAQPPRPGDGPQKGTSVLRGYVTAADTGNPLRRALVRAISQDGHGNSTATTDADGRFEIKELRGGRYSLSVSKAGYVTMSYGQRRPEQQGTTLEILDGQLVEKIGFVLPRGGVITGTLLDEFGDAIAGAQVSALRYRFSGSGRRLMPSGSVTTDDRGVFRIYGLAPGDYYVSAGVRTAMMISGPMASPTPGPVDGYTPTYYPGTANPSEATRLTVRAAQETANVSFALIAARLARVSGRVVSSTGEPVVQAPVMAMPADRLIGGGILQRITGMTRADGSFELAGLAPGNYMIALLPRTRDADSEFANLRVTIANDNVDNLLLVTRRGGIARGIITTDENTPPDVRPQQVRVFVRPLAPEIMSPGGMPRVNDDWTFELSGLSDPGVLLASIAEAPEWTLKAVLHNGLDVTDTGMEFALGETVEGLQIVFTRKRTELSGNITNERGAPDTDATVIVFSQDSARWGFASRYVRVARPSQGGRYLLRVPPSDYYVAVVKNVESGQWTDPEFLESVRDYAVRVSITEGETKVQDLKVTQP